MGRLSSNDGFKENPSISQHHSETNFQAQPADLHPRKRTLSRLAPEVITPSSTLSTPFQSTPLPSATPLPTQPAISRSAKIGIFVGIAVVVVLGLIGCIMGVLDCRRRYKKRQERKKNRNAELQMLEAQMRDGQGGQRKKEREMVGLWDSLKGWGPREENQEENKEASGPVEEDRGRTRERARRN